MNIVVDQRSEKLGSLLQRDSAENILHERHLPVMRPKEMRFGSIVVLCERYQVLRGAAVTLLETPDLANEFLFE
jgi:hypothetical protein